MAAKVVISSEKRCMRVRECIIVLKSAAKVRPFCESTKKMVWKNTDSQKGLICLIPNGVRGRGPRRGVEKLLSGGEIQAQSGSLKSLRTHFQRGISVATGGAHDDLSTTMPGSVLGCMDRSRVA